MKKSVLLLIFLLSAFFSTRADDLLDDVLGGATASPLKPSEDAVPAAVPTSDNAQMQALKAQVAELKSIVESNALARQKEVAQPFAAGDQSLVGHTENPAILLFRVGMGSERRMNSIQHGGSLRSYISTLEIRKPFKKSHFDLAYEGMYCFNDFSMGYEEHVPGARAFCLWNPFRGHSISPYAGVGLQYTSVSLECWGDEEEYRRFCGGIEDGLSFAIRLGVTIDFKRLSLIGEYVFSDGVEQLIADLSFYCNERTRLHAFVESLELNYPEPTLCYGGGLSYDF